MHCSNCDYSREISTIVSNKVSLNTSDFSVVNVGPVCYTCPKCLKTYCKDCLLKVLINNNGCSYCQSSISLKSTLKYGDIDIMKLIVEASVDYYIKHRNTTLKQKFNNSNEIHYLEDVDEVTDVFINYHNELNTYLSNQYNTLKVRQDVILNILKNNKDEVTLRDKLEEPCYLLWKYRFGIELIKRIQRLIARYVKLMSTKPNREEEYSSQLDSWLYSLNTEVEAYDKIFDYPIPKFVSDY